MEDVTTSTETVGALLDESLSTVAEPNDERKEFVERIQSEVKQALTQGMFGDTKLRQIIEKADNQNETTFQLLQQQRYATKFPLLLGFCHLYGFCGAKKDAELAFQHFQLSAEHHDPFGQNQLGKCYQNGCGIPKDKEKAFHWYEKAANAGNSEGQDNLGWCYQNGFGVLSSKEKALYWYEKAAKSGYQNRFEKNNPSHWMSRWKVLDEGLPPLGYGHTKCFTCKESPRRFPNEASRREYTEVSGICPACLEIGLLESCAPEYDIEHARKVLLFYNRKLYIQEYPPHSWECLKCNKYVQGEKTRMPHYCLTNEDLKTCLKCAIRQKLSKERLENAQTKLHRSK
ncbi:15002_t:CDS:2 [Acaulospora colombiana]|uniref:15002_t:CDS:1 n=1 Tax=Acaulospora colombiana TaxID=27376 RepID=A0ACA9N135_9GLOM|nr:15002_t:CDS:2 [Acaulospora colombiana]